MAMVSSTAGAEPRPGSSRVSESSAGKLSSKMVSSLVSDSGWSSASHSDAFVPRLVLGRRGAIVFCIPIIGLHLDFRLILHINVRIVKRNLGQRNPV